MRGTFRHLFNLHRPATMNRQLSFSNLIVSVSEEKSVTNVKMVICG